MYTLVTGSYPPDVCGVGDYTSKVFTSDYAKSNGWKLYYIKNGWKIRSFFRRLKDLSDSESDTIIFEMPTLGYGKSLTPHFIVAILSRFSKKKIVVRLHEYIQLSRKARAAVSIMLMTANHVIFTNEYDRDAACKSFKRLRTRSGIVKIYSNIAGKDRLNKYKDRPIDLVYFGHIRKQKGIERYIDCIETLKNCRKINATIIGQVPMKYENYCEDIKQRANEVGIELKINASENEVIETLNNSKISFLPFPDGLSERRGSFLAAIKNGCVVVSTPGQYSKGKISKAAFLSNDATKQERMILTLLNDEITWNEFQKRGLDFLKEEMPTSWSDVAERYNKSITRQ